MRKIILIVSNGNMQRSVIAEQCINKILRERGLDGKYFAISRGIQGTCGTAPPKHKNLRDYPMEWKLAEPVLDEIGITIPVDKVSTPISASDAEQAVIILVVEKGVHKEKPNCLHFQFPQHKAKMLLLTELEDRNDDVIALYGQNDAALVRQEILKIVKILHTHFDDLIRLADGPIIEK